MLFGVIWFCVPYIAFASEVRSAQCGVLAHCGEMSVWYLYDGYIRRICTPGVDIWSRAVLPKSAPRGTDCEPPSQSPRQRYRCTQLGTVDTGAAKAHWLSVLPHAQKLHKYRGKLVSIRLLTVV